VKVEWGRRVLLLGLAGLALGGAPAARAVAAPLSFRVDSARARSLGGSRTVAAIPQGFVGASIDYCSITYYADGAGSARVLANLIGALAGGRALLRVGGNGPEAPCPGRIHHPASTAIRAIRAVESVLAARLLLGIDLEAHRLQKVRREVLALVHGLGGRATRRRIAAFEIGNEPDRYPRYGPSVPKRRARPFFARYLRDFERWTAVIGRAARKPGFPVAGPALGRLGLPWITPPNGGDFVRFVNSPARPKYVTFHRYALLGVGRTCPGALCPTIPNLLSDAASRGLARPLARFVAATPPGRVLRIDEMNSITGGGTNGVSSTFAAALWALDASFEMAHVGASGVNFHSFSDAAYALFSRTAAHGWIVRPEYYGLLMFSRAAPAGSLLLRVHPDRAPSRGANVNVWATHGRDGRTRVLIINKDPLGHDVLLSGGGLPGTGSASLLPLRAAAIGDGDACPPAYGAVGLCAFGEVSLGGRSFGPLVLGYPAGDATSTGILAPPRATCDSPLPRNCETTLRAGRAEVSVPAASAVLLTAP